MKKFLIILAIALGMGAMQSCKCTSDVKAESIAFTYDLGGIAEGKGIFNWGKGVHMGEVVLDGKVVVSATNDTSAVRVLTAASTAKALRLRDALNSNDVEVKEAAEGAYNKLYEELSLTGLEGKVTLGVTGYVSYGPMVFAIDEHWEYPSAE